MDVDIDPQEGSISRHDKYNSVVPWRDSEEFLTTYHCLYSPSISDKRWAVDQISVWETRCHPALPTAIEATVGLVRAVIQDMLYEVEKTFCQEQDIQMLFAMALVRFVNLTVEIDKYSQARTSMSVLADQRNIPKWIVDLRHEATHAFFPSLPVLRMGATEALQYLEESFWKVELANVQPITKTPSNVEETIKDVITSYKNVQLCRAAEELSEDTGETSKFNKDIEELIKELRSLVKCYNKKFVDALVQPGVFLSAKDLIQLLQITDRMFLIDEDILNLPHNLEAFWLPVFRILHSCDLIFYFMEMLLLSQEHCTNALCQKTAVAWTMYLLNATSPTSPMTLLTKRFQAKGVQLDLHRLLYATMKGMSRFTLHLFTTIGSKIGNGDMQQFSDLCYIMAVHQGLLLDKDQQDKRPSKDPIVFTLQDLEDDINEVMRQRKRRAKPSVWSMAPLKINFADLPIGAVMNPKFPSEKGNTTTKDATSSEEKFIEIDKNDNDVQEPTVEVRITTENLFKEPEIRDMMYRGKERRLQ